LKLSLEAAASSWPCECEKFHHFFDLFFGLHQGLGLIMMLSVTRASILRLWLEVAPGSWPYECEKFHCFFNLFFGLRQGLG
jgi:hypothetical protein